MHVNCQQLDLENMSLHFIYLKFAYDRAGPSLLGGLSWLGSVGTHLQLWRQPPHREGAPLVMEPGAQGARLSACGSGLILAPWHVESSPAGHGTDVPALGKVDL